MQTCARALLGELALTLILTLAAMILEPPLILNLPLRSTPTRESHNIDPTMAYVANCNRDCTNATSGNLNWVSIHSCRAPHCPIVLLLAHIRLCSSRSVPRDG